MLQFIFDVASWAAIPLMILGFFPLIKGADWLVDGGSAVAKRLNIPTLVIGLTIVAFGTSMPELIVTVFSAAGGSGDIAVGNILGSNIFNILAILGISAAIYPVAVRSSTVWFEIPMTLLASLMVALLANDMLFDGAAHNSISRIDGLVLLAFFLIFLVYNIVMAKNGEFDSDLAIKDWKTAKAVLFIVLGLAALIIGGRIIVESAVETARSFGIPERIIGLTIVSIGTSLPELATSAVAAFKKNADIAIGNILGSNIFNTFLILGLTAAIQPMALHPATNVDILVGVGSTFLLMLFAFLPKPRFRHLNRIEGWVFIAGFAAYMTYLIVSTVQGSAT